ncbi:MAG TPA: tyrosine-type recombinase/integrase [Paludibaculum sp.]
MPARIQHGNLRKRRSGGVLVWLGSWREDGRHPSKTLGTVSSMTKTEAEAALAKIVQEVNERRGTVEYTLQGFTKHVVFPWYERKWKSSTAQTTEDRIDHHILKELGNKPLSCFTRTTLQDFLDAKAASGLSHSTVAHLRWDLQQIFRMAVNDGLLPRNTAELLHTPRGTVREQRVLTLAQATIMLSVLPLRERLIVKLAGVCGMRPGEIVALQWHDIKEKSLLVQRRLYRGKIDTPKTRNSTRKVALPSSVVEDINAWRAIAPNTAPEAWVFPSETGTTPLWANNAWYDKIRPTLTKIGLGWVNYQALRRSAVTLLNATGADGTIVAAQCGHTVDVSTNVYNKVGIERQLHAVQVLDTALHARASVA